MAISILLLMIKCRYSFVCNIRFHHHMPPSLTRWAFNKHQVTFAVFVTWPPVAVWLHSGNSSSKILGSSLATLSNVSSITTFRMASRTLRRKSWKGAATRVHNQSNMTAVYSNQTMHITACKC